MSGSPARMRVFAGPNGSGKSVLKSYLPPALLGVYLNPDEIEASIRIDGVFDFQAVGVETTASEVLPAFVRSSFLARQGLAVQATKLKFAGGRLDFTNVLVNSYFASVLVGFLRQKLIEQQATFTFETVMSHPDKVEVLADAQRAGYRTYLYYVATSDPEINVSRVANRVGLGGHAVPVEKIVSRYHRSLALLRSAIRHTDRAYIFDNSVESRAGGHTWVAEITGGTRVELKTDQLPVWFMRAVLEKAQ